MRINDQPEFTMEWNESALEHLMTFLNIDKDAGKSIQAAFLVLVGDAVRANANEITVEADAIEDGKPRGTWMLRLTREDRKHPTRNVSIPLIDTIEKHGYQCVNAVRINRPDWFLRQDFHNWRNDPRRPASWNKKQAGYILTWEEGTDFTKHEYEDTICVFDNVHTPIDEEDPGWEGDWDGEPAMPMDIAREIGLVLADAGATYGVVWISAIGEVGGNLGHES